MDYIQKIEKIIYRGIKGLIFSGLFVCLFVGCKTVSYMPVTQQLHDSVYVDRWLRDSVYLHDSVFVNRWTQGDTVFVDKVVTRYKYKDRWRHDTVAVVRVDSVRVPYPVEKELSIWEMTKIVFCSPLVVSIVLITAGCIGWLISWLVKKLRKK